MLAERVEQLLRVAANYRCLEGETSPQSRDVILGGGRRWDWTHKCGGGLLQKSESTTFDWKRGPVICGRSVTPDLLWGALIRWKQGGNSCFQEKLIKAALT